MRQLLTAIAFLTVFFSQACASRVGARSFINLDSRDGLAQNNVKSIVQDQYGFIWLGTKNGLCRYDGRQVQTFRVQDPTDGTANQNVSALLYSRSGRLWVGTDECIFLYDARTERFRHVRQAAQDGMVMENWVAELKEDAQGRVWAVIPNEGIFRISPDGGEVFHYQTPNNTRGEQFSTLCITPDGQVWASGWNTGLWLLEPATDQFRQTTTDADGRSLLTLQTNTLCSYQGAIVLAVQDGQLLSYDLATHRLTPFATDFSHTIVRGAVAFGQDLLVGTYDGLYILSPDGDHHFRHDLAAQASLADDIVYTIFRDREGGTWVGTAFGGVSYLPPQPLMFSTITHDADGHQLSSDRIRDLALAGGRLFVGTDDHGLNSLDLTTGRIQPQFAALSTIRDDISLCLQPHDGFLYQSINKKGVKVINPASGTATFLTSPQLHLPEGCTIYDLLFDSHGRAWMATDWGLWLSTTGRLTEGRPVQELRELWIYDLLEDSHGNVWGASMGSGLFCIDGTTGQVRRFLHDPADPASLSSNSASSLFEDSRGLIWVSTDRGGLCAYEPATQHFRCFSTQQGLPDDCAYQVLEDSHHNLWFGTNRGLVRLNPETSQIRVFTTRHGLPGNQFNYKSALAAPDGIFYFGTTNGLVACRPIPSQATASQAAASCTSAPDSSSLFFTRLAIGGTEVSPSSPSSPLKTSIIETERITLPPGHATLSLDIAYLSFAAAKTTAYAYRLQPIDRNWTPLPDGASIAFANLAPGDYVLHLRATTLEGDQPQHERTLRITVLPPWWQSWWAYLIYFALLGAIAVAWFRWYRRRKEHQFQERQRLFAIQKEKELGERKVQLFTEIAHEIRTPLTLISGPLEVVMQQLKPQEAKGPLHRNLTVIQQNTHRLLGLADQLLDFQKADTGEMHLHPESTDISRLLQDTVNRFEPTFTHRGKHLLATDLPTGITAVIDREATTKIISNLLTNALKYGSTLCRVTLSAPTAPAASSAPPLLLSVFSDGQPIPAVLQQAIFDPFVQLEGRNSHQGGVGIGLALCRTLAAMQGGQLSLSTSPEGNTFLLSLPLSPTGTPPVAPAIVPAAASTEPSPPEADSSETTSSILPTIPSNVRGATILVVDDEEGIRDFLAERLSEDFLTETAANGEEAFSLLKSKHIDLVLTDVMMPVMDGVALCRLVKQDPDLSHIPVILLTAKNDLNTKIEGLRMGAESYIEKPFAWDYLHQQVISLLANRQKEREAFAKRPFFPLTGMQMSHEDEAFMNRAMEVINNHISDENFNVEAMADALCMSRSSLLRKIKTLFDMPPLDFIRLIRLKRAAELIQEGRYRMGEICERVGFSSHSYFSKLFARQFGMTPKEFEKQLELQRTKVKDLRQ